MKANLVTLAVAVLSLGIALPASARPAVLVGVNSDRVNVRLQPTADAASPHYGQAGDRVEILGQAQGADGQTWYYINSAGGAQGWVRSDWVSSPNSVAYYRPAKMLLVQSQNYRINLYKQQGQLFMDVQNRRTGRMVINKAITEVIHSEQSTTYLNSTGDFCYLIKQLPTGHYILEVNHKGRTIAQERAQML